MTSRHNFYMGLGILIGIAYVLAAKAADLIGGWINLACTVMTIIMIGAAALVTVHNHNVTKES